MNRRTALVVAASLTVFLLALPSGPAGASCPTGKAGLLESSFNGSGYEFDWDIEMTPTSFGAGEKAVVDLAIIPFEIEDTHIYLTHGGMNYVTLVLDSNGTSPSGVGHTPGKWNNVRIVADYDADQYVVTINGDTSKPIAFNSAASQLSAVKLYTSDVGGPTSDDGWVDSIKISKKSDADNDLVMAEDFQDDTPPDPTIGDITQMKPPTMQAGTGANCPTSITLKVDKSPQSLEAKGAVRPAHPGKNVVVKLFRKLPGGFDLVKKKTDSTDMASRYSLTFNRPNANRCRFSARFPGDADHRASTAVKTFDC